MSITSGFFNSLNGDRKYDTVSISEIFNGVIVDGVFSTVGDKFIATVPDEGGTSILISTGRAWFNNVWIKNDSILAIPSTSPDLIRDRIDAVVFNVDTSEAVRAATIVYVEGIASTSPTKPNMLVGEYVNQYPICYITRKAGTSTITQAYIENAVGQDDCPFVIGAASTISIADLTLQWKSQWDDWSDSQKEVVLAFISEQTESFNDWYANMRAVLDDDVAANLTAAVSDLQTDVENIETNKSIKSTYIQSTINTTSWSGNTYQGIQNSYAFDDYDVEIQPSNSCSDATLDIWSDAKFLGSDTTNYIYARGDKPTVDIPVILKVTPKN